jgi:WD40 repeat protein
MTVLLPQIITGSHDKTVKMWDLRKGKTLSTLTYHKKSIRAMAAHPQDFAFAAGSADNIKKYRLPQVRAGIQGSNRVLSGFRRNKAVSTWKRSSSAKLYPWDVMR